MFGLHTTICLYRNLQIRIDASNIKTKPFSTKSVRKWFDDNLEPSVIYSQSSATMIQDRSNNPVKYRFTTEQHNHKNKGLMALHCTQGLGGERAGVLGGDDAGDSRRGLGPTLGAQRRSISSASHTVSTWRAAAAARRLAPSVATAGRPRLDGAPLRAAA